MIQCPKTSTVNGKGDITIIDAGTFNDHFDPKAFGNYLEGATINYVILTHPHTDHYSLIDSILYGHTENIKVYHSCEWEKYNGEKHKVTKLIPDKSSRIGYCMEGGDTPCNKELKLCDSVTLKVIASELGKCVGNPNEDSIVSKITYMYNGVSTLISGDLEGNDTFMSKFIDEARDEIKANIYRLAHHGAYSDKKMGLKPNRPDLLKAVGASYYFSSSGLHEGYRHPRCKLYNEIMSHHTHLQVDNHPYTCYRDGGTTYSSTTDSPIYVTTLKEKGHRKDYVIRFAIKKDGTIKPTITPFDGDLKAQGHKEL